MRLPIGSLPMGHHLIPECDSVLPRPFKKDNLFNTPPTPPRCGLDERVTPLTLFELLSEHSPRQRAVPAVVEPVRELELV